MLMSQSKINRAQNEMYIIIPIGAQTFVLLKKLCRYFTCIVRVENYYSARSTDILSMVKSMKMFKTYCKDVFFVRITLLTRRPKI